MNNKGHTEMIKALANTVLWVVVACLISANVIAQTSIASAVGVVGEGEVIVLNGGGFGAAGPSIIMWDDFDCPGGDANPCSGLTTWSSEGGGAPQFVKVGPVDSRGSAASFDFSGAFNTSEVITAGFIGAPNYNEIYVSYWRKFDYVDPGTNDFTHTQFYLRGSVGQNPKIFLDILKGSFGWGIQAEGVGGGTLSKDSVQGWDLNIEQSSYHRWEWYAAIDSGAANDVLKGWLDGVKGWDVSDNLDGGSGAYKSFYFGYSNTNNTTNLDARAFFDDVYIATSRARVEVCNTSTWSASNKQCEIQIVEASTDWSDSTVTFRMRSGGFGALAGKFLYVIHQDGSVNNIGFDINNVNAPPVANNFTVTPEEGQLLNVLFSEVLLHATDLNGDVLTVTTVTNNPGNIDAAIDVTDPTNPKVNYSILDYNSNDLSFNYTVSDGALEATGTITVSFEKDNCPGIANPNDIDFDNDGVGNACDKNIDGDSDDNVADISCPGFIGGASACDMHLCFPPVRPAPTSLVLAPTIDGDVSTRPVGSSPGFDDAWTNAYAYTFESGTDMSDVRFQAVKPKNDNSHIYMSFEVFNDVSFDSNDLIVLAFRPGSTSYEVKDGAPTYPTGAAQANEDIRIFIQPLCSNQGVGSNENCTSPISGGSEDGYTEIKRGQPRKVEIWKNSADNWAGAQVIDPALLDMEIAVRSHLESGNEFWSVELKLPAGANSAAGWPGFADNFLMYFNVVTAFETGSVVQYMWPGSVAAQQALENTYDIEGNVYSYPFQNYEWAFGHRGADQSVCKGVSIETSGIGTKTTTDDAALKNTISGRIIYDPNYATSGNDWVNRFYATVKNDGPLAEAVTATFRIADWGYNNYQSGTFREIPGNENPTASKNVAEGPSEAEFTLDWIIGVADIPRYVETDGGTGESHQCVLVELNSGEEVTFTKRSDFINMNFSATASVFERDASLSSKGYIKRYQGAKEHEFELYVKSQKLTADKAKELQKPWLRPTKEKSAKTLGGGLLDFCNEESTVRWVSQGYYKTGKSITINRESYRLLESTGAYGYHVTHTGCKVLEWDWDYLLSEKYLKDSLVSFNKVSDESFKVVLSGGGKTIKMRAEIWPVFPKWAPIVEFIVKYFWWVFVLLIILIWVVHRYSTRK